MNIAENLPKLADRTGVEFRFLTNVTPAMCVELREMHGDALHFAQDARDRADEVRWSKRFYKLAALNEAAAMVLLLTPPWESKWPVVDKLVLDEDGVCRP